MCGRYIVEDNENSGEMRKILTELKRHYSDTREYRQIRIGEIFPSDVAPVIIPAKADRIDAIPMKWGFNHYSGRGLVINARSEGIERKRMFKDALIKRRCVVPTNGFYEWQKYSDGRKSEKYLITNPSTPMLYLAGIYDSFVDFRTGKNRVQFVIITRESRGLIRSLHSRMPVQIEKKDILKWLNGNRNHIEEIFYGEIPEYSLRNVDVPDSQSIMGNYGLL